MIWVYNPDIYVEDFCCWHLFTRLIVLLFMFHYDHNIDFVSPSDTANQRKQTVTNDALLV